MNLTIDIGNTRTKMVVFDGATPVHEEILTGHLQEAIRKLAQHYPLKQCAWCSVCGNDEEQGAMLSDLGFPVRQLTGTSEVPLTVCYQSPQTLGADRLAAVLGATALCPQCDLLVIDAGTCITYDLADAKGHYLGGNISPGIEMRLKALHHYTARLPLVEAAGNLPAMGIDTETAIRCGVIEGVRFEIEGYVTRLRTIYPQLQIFLTGGGRFHLPEQMLQHFRYDPHLVSRGLNRILGTPPSSIHTTHIDDE